jgi:catechol 2,3-dioxygenase-like lactoylglutathione lyase family enzyme
MKRSARMMTLMVMAAVVTLAAGRTALAQTLAYDHVHMAVPDPVKAAEWYGKHLGGAPGLTNDRVVYGTTILAFLKADKARPSAGGAVEHIGLSFPDLDAKLKELEAAGAKILNPARDVPNLFKLAFVEDPWGVKLEIVQDAEFPGFHHVHLRVADPEASFKWYQQMFGGDRAKLKGQIEGLRYGNVWLLAQASKPGEQVPPSAGSTIDHIGWRPEVLDTTAATLRTRGATFTTEPREAGNLRIAFLEGPGGVRIELVQRPR